jgi:hypothetical protein
MANEQTPPAAGTGNQNQEPAWKTAGFESETAFTQAATEATTLRSKLQQAEADLEKERTSRQKTDGEYLRQSNEVGTLRQQLKDAEEKLKVQKPPEPDKTDDEVLNALSDDDIKNYDEILAKPENAEIAAAVEAGGKPAMAEFVRNYRKLAPKEKSKGSIFASLRKKSDMVPKASIANMVKTMMEKNETQNRNQLPASSAAGSPPDRSAPAKTKVSPIGTVTTDFFRKDKAQA